MSSENNECSFDETEATITYIKLDKDDSILENNHLTDKNSLTDKNPLAEIMDRMNNLTLASFSPNKENSVVGDSSIELSNVESKKNDDQVYLQCFVDTIRTLQKKFNKIMKNKFVHKELLTDVFEKIQSGDTESAKNSLKHILDKKVVFQINQKEISNFIEITFPMLFKQLIDDLENLNMLKKDIFDTNKSILETFHERNNQSKVVKKEINELIQKFRNEISDILKIPENDTIESFFKNLTETLQKFNKEFVNLKQENKTLKDNSDIEDLKKQLEDKKMTIKQLQAQNVSFSEVITKLDTTNIKLKKECVILSNEYKKVVDSMKLKSTIIEKQKKILEVLQKQVGGKHDFPIEDLKRKIEKLQKKVEKEENPEKKNKLKKEIIDCEKRISDYENLQKN